MCRGEPTAHEQRRCWHPYTGQVPVGMSLWWRDISIQEAFALLRVVRPFLQRASSECLLCASDFTSASSLCSWATLTAAGAAPLELAQCSRRRCQVSRLPTPQSRSWGRLQVASWASSQ